ncbi:exodeoxyribonuclease VII small subunit [Kingella negevensis]|uniref:Exodeoxyribonuclease 7 small subunit n=1 Tax=Kingella negevensis TaxID=1522312 RepID=A0A238HIY2_9NEIS|nr:exodeoxyribonuclease VII small subunit [Kingella negevensis]MDK4679399.1 exodeoxyribonuclease VII small subunit [Kingella negevensis]MDK4682883.1 exodeoxyribonuclease VII small subunit [Kingella negevensis]MDK4685206.1 exodeoxyribonuclease VII small subunit [Kingella negevensis]MDK4689585.1 exodeoxyribonuclease VII small subunit [Kingella negevensis]MDK4691080.1 exodeoxyribonuclease VII small subunit [Kingella negevensis]
MARKSPKNLEDAMARLEVITQTMQNTVLPLEEALATYEEGVELVRYCQQKLAAVEHAIQVLDNNDLKELELESE